MSTNLPGAAPWPADHASRECLVQEMLALSDPHRLPPSTLQQIAVRLAAYVQDAAAELASLEGALPDPLADRAFEAVLRARTTQLRARHALADPPEATLRCAQQYARLARILHAHREELAALAAPETPATERDR
ncbi:hypothetical protein AB0E74_27810 [Streptomyces sp. NPDC030392]|uniref:hypothetical protein n=1 Tax=Streptomyces sp. NPDC030392 TaxID=3155468 RepID=UPI0033C77D54